jgi:ComF family protein
VAYGLYEGRMKAAIHSLKYNGVHPASRRLGVMLAQAIAQFAADAPAEMLVIPVPLNRAKQSQRGFNQAHLITEHALEALRKSNPNWRLRLAPNTLMRLRETVSQAGLSPTERRFNLRGAFTVADPAAVKSKDILLIDDILTTGATARAASKALIRSGAASVWVATLARARRVSDFGRVRSSEIDASENDEDNFDLGSGFPEFTLQSAASAIETERIESTEKTGKTSASSHG